MCLHATPVAGVSRKTFIHSFRPFL